MGVQRHLKASGIFARLYHRDGKSGYLPDIPRTVGYIAEVAPNHPELDGLARLLESRVLPRLEDAVPCAR
jgi:aminoglycoside/choline kinase family phosphotransferase